LFPTLDGIEQARAVLERWLASIGLELKPSKTRIVHTLMSMNESPAGFDFLGFEVRQYPVGKYRSGKHNGKRLGFKTIIQPSKEAIKHHREALRMVVHAGQGLTQEALIGQLNPKIRGWARYYRSVVAKKVLNDCDYHLYPLLLRWAKRRHPRKSASWIRLRYWAKRLQQSHPLTMSRLGALLHKQQGKCRWCELLFQEGDLIEIDHITPRREGGTDDPSNLFALHRHGHDQRHAKKHEWGTHDRSYPTEEPDEVETLMSGSGGGQEGAIPLA
jgi:RNA-directed DNA polymerase